MIVVVVSPARVPATLIQLIRQICIVLIIASASNTGCQNTIIIHLTTITTNVLFEGIEYGNTIQSDPYGSIEVKIGWRISDLWVSRQLKRIVSCKILGRGYALVPCYDPVGGRVIGNTI